MAKKLKTKISKIGKASKASSKRSVRPQVISFRVTAHQAKTLTEIFKRDLATNINSPNQLARKVVCDYLAGRLDYRNPDDKLLDMDVIGVV